MYHLKSDSFLLLCIIYESGSSLCQLKSLRENDSPQIYCVGEVENHVLGNHKKCKRLLLAGCGFVFMSQI